MIRAAFIIWCLPSVLFIVAAGGWYFLSYNDINFGIYLLSREYHDAYFNLAGQMLNMDPDKIPGRILWLFVVDAVIISAFVLLTKTRHIWWPEVKNLFAVYILRRQPNQPVQHRDPIKTAIGPMHPAE